MWKNIIQQHKSFTLRNYSRVSQSSLNCSSESTLKVSKKNTSHLGVPKKKAPKPRQLLSLPPFPTKPLPAKNLKIQDSYVTAISWIKYYFDEIPGSVVQSHFHKGLVQIKHNEVMKAGDRIILPVSIAECRISRRFDTIPSGTLYPNADEIQYLQRLVMYKDSSLIVLNKPSKLPVKGNLPVHNSMDALATAALSYNYDEGPKLVHRLDRESSGILLMGRTKESISHLSWLFSDINKSKSAFKAWNDACEATYQRYWALVIGSPKEKDGLICAPLSKVLVDDGKGERVILGNGKGGLEACQEAITEYRVLGPTINGCSWLELRPLTSRKHQIRVHCAEALGTPIVGDYKYGWFVHRKWKQMSGSRIDVEPTSGEPYRLRRPKGLDVQKGSVLSKVPLLHLHCRELVLPNISKLLPQLSLPCDDNISEKDSRSDLLRFVASMPSHMKISWNLMSSYLI